MNRETLDNLTSAEAGFLYGVLRSGTSDDAGWTVDELAAKPLADAVEAVDGEEVADQTVDRLEYGRLTRWRNREIPERSAAFRRSIDSGLDWLEADNVPAAIRRRQARCVVRRTLAGTSGDLSALSPGVLDLRWWFRNGGIRVVGLRLVVLGAVLVASLDRVAVRRRMASMLRGLPVTVREEIRRGLEVMPELDPAVARRVYEVYGSFADRDLRADDELALLGLFFVVSAAVFRHNGELDRLESALRGPLSRRCRTFRRALLESDKPELSPEIAETIRPVVAAGGPAGRNSEPETNDGGSDE